MLFCSFLLMLVCGGVVGFCSFCVCVWGGGVPHIMLEL